MAAAAIAFTQPGGGGVGSPGFAMVGAVSLPVTISNGTAQSTYLFELLDCPDESAISKGVKQSGTSPTFSFTPDVQGPFLWHLQTTDSSGNVADDYRAFIVPELSSGQIIPPFGATAPMVNYPTPGGPGANNARGWATEMEQWLRRLDVPLVRLVAGPVTLTPLVGFVEFNGSSPINVVLPAANKKPLRRFYFFKNLTAQANTITPAGTNTIESGTPGAAITLSGAKTFTILATDGIGNWDVCAGASSAGQVASREGTPPFVTNATSFITAAVVAFDPTKLAARTSIKLRVIVETTGPQITVQLYNVTASAVVTGSTLTSTSTAPVELVTGDLTAALGAGDAIYQVQIKMAGGGVPSDMVNLDYSRLEAALS